MKKLINLFAELFQKQPHFVARAPGRVNLIGEHTDYNEGFVFPMAINREIRIVFSPREDNRIKIHSINFDNMQEFSLDNLSKNNEAHWIDYIQGVAWVLQKHYPNLHLKGFNGVLEGDVPRGAGLSSSAALEVLITRVFATINHISWEGKSMARVAQQAENQWVGMQCGIMDQLASACGKANHALLIDCRDLSIQPILLPKDIAIVIMDTKTRRGLVGSAYNDRRAQCEEAAKFFGVNFLRDVSLERFEKEKHGLSTICQKRAKHIITENIRTLQMAEALKNNDLIQVGELLYEGHKSLKNDFEVSCENLDIMVNCANKHAGCFGARMTGGGFGGCAVAVVKADMAESFKKQVVQEYEYETKLTPSLYITQATEGASCFSL